MTSFVMKVAGLALLGVAQAFSTSGSLDMDGGLLFKKSVSSFDCCVFGSFAASLCCVVCAVLCVLEFDLRACVCVFACFLRPSLTRRVLARRCGFRRVVGRKFPCALGCVLCS